AIRPSRRARWLRSLSGRAPSSEAVSLCPSATAEARRAQLSAPPAEECAARHLDQLPGDVGGGVGGKEEDGAGEGPRVGRQAAERRRLQGPPRVAVSESGN